MSSRKDTLALLRRTLEIESVRLEEASYALAQAFALYREARDKMERHQRVVDDAKERLEMLMEEK